MPASSAIRRLALSSLVGGAMAIGVAASAQTKFPEKPITVMVGFEAGGRIDALARLLGEQVETALGQPVVVMAKPGGGGGVMASLVKAAPADGYTLGLSVTITWAFNPFYGDGTPYRPEDFSYVATLGDGKPGFFVRAEAPWKTLKDLVADAKAGRSVSFVSIAPSVRLQINHIARQEGIRFRIVTARGGAEVVPMILGGHADFGFSGGFHNSYAKAGKLRILAITDHERLAEFPDVPTLADLGYESFPPGYILIAAPKGTPAAITRTLAGAFETALKSERVRETMDRMDVPVAFNGPEATDGIIRDQAVYFQRLIREEREGK